MWRSWTHIGNQTNGSGVDEVTKSMESTEINDRFMSAVTVTTGKTEFIRECVDESS